MYELPVHQGSKKVFIQSPQIGGKCVHGSVFRQRTDSRSHFPHLTVPESAVRLAQLPHPVQFPAGLFREGMSGGGVGGDHFLSDLSLMQQDVFPDCQMNRCFSLHAVIGDCGKFSTGKRDPVQHSLSCGTVHAENGNFPVGQPEQHSQRHQSRIVPAGKIEHEFRIPGKNVFQGGQNFGKAVGVHDPHGQGGFDLPGGEDFPDVGHQCGNSVSVPAEKNDSAGPERQCRYDIVNRCFIEKFNQCHTTPL